MTEFPPDTDLIRAAQAGDAEAFVTLCERHRSRLWRAVTSVAKGHDADDLAQEAVVRAYRALATYRADAPFEAWLCRVALNAAHDHRKSAWRRRVTLWQQTPETCLGEAESPEGTLEKREREHRIRQAVATLPAKQRAPIWLHFFEEFTIAEVARLERVPESTVRSRMQAGMKKLSHLLGDLLEYPPAPPVPLTAEAKGCGVV